MNNASIRIKKQILLNILDAYQATSVIRAIAFSSNASHPLLLHLYSVEYQAIVTNIHKLFDKPKSSVNLVKLVAYYKNEIENDKYIEFLRNIEDIQKRSEKTLRNIENLRNNLVVHVSKNNLVEILENDNNSPELTEIQTLLKDIINELKKLSFLNSEDIDFLEKRMAPKDVMDFLGLSFLPEFNDKILEDLFSANINKQKT